jgi:aspartokinase
LRRSKRRADTTGEPSLEHAVRIKAARNLDFNLKKGTKNTSHALFLQFSNEHVVDNLSVVGISLGSNMESVTNSVACVREDEIKILYTVANEDKISSIFDKKEKEEMEAEEVDKFI